MEKRGVRRAKARQVTLRVCAVVPSVTAHRVGGGTGLEVRVKKQSHLGWQQCFRKINLQTEMEGGQKEPSEDVRGEGG